MSADFVSICIPVFNGQTFLEQCLNSAIGQTYKDIEIIILDDCSTDNTYQIALQYAAKDSRIKLFRNDKNIGLVPNWNKCLELAKGEWIKFLFQDDYLSPDCIEIMVNSISPADMLIVSARRLIIDEAVDEATKSYSIKETLTFERLGIATQTPVFIPPQKISAFAVQNICMNFIGEPTVIMFKKELVKELGIFNSDLIQICDLEYFLRIASNYGIQYIPKSLTYFRVHNNSASSANISNKFFFIRYTDPMIMAYELLFGDSFANFRRAITSIQKMKIKLFFLIRIRETLLFLKSDSASENVKTQFELLNRKYKFTDKYKLEKIIVALLLPMVNLKRNYGKRKYESRFSLNTYYK